jgi:hypothetical protein
MPKDGYITVVDRRYMQIVNYLGKAAVAAGQ